MTKWADYLISAARYNKAHTKIQQVCVHPDKDDKVGKKSIWERIEVVETIENRGKSFCTIWKESPSGGKWKKGADIHLFLVEDEKFLRTDKNEIEEDNLGALPEF